MSKAKITSWVLVFSTKDKLLNGRKPPDEIIDIDRLKESKVRNSKNFKIIKINKVNNE